MSGDLSWPKFSKFIVAWQLFDTAVVPNDRARARLDRRLEGRMFEMADRAAEVLGGSVSGVESLAGGYLGIGVGDKQGEIVIPSFEIGRDGLVTYAFESDGITHPEAHALDAELTIYQYKAYLDVYRVTGGEIRSKY